MYIDTYINSSDNEKLNKSLTTVASSVSVILKDDTDILNPVLILKPGTSDFNYCYISEFNRYYHVIGRDCSQQRLIYTLKVDHLYSWASEISDVRCIAQRSSNKFDMLLADGDFPVRADKLVQTEPFSNGFGGESYVLAVAGGYVPPSP